MPARQLILAPEVSGRILWHAPELVPGGTIEAGTVLVRINPLDYQLALRQSQAQVATQQLSLQVEESRRKIAEREWELFKKSGSHNGNKKPEQGSLALRGPQLQSAQIALQAARSNVSQAQVLLSRTTLSAPFNAIVQQESVEIGQLVAPSAPLVTLVGTDRFWVQVSLPIDKLRFVELPLGDEPGSPAQVWVDTGDGRITRKGRVIRLLGDLDPVARMARVLVEIEDPLGLSQGRAVDAEPNATLPPSGDDTSPTQSSLPLLLGSYVHVAIDGRELANVVTLPRRALQPGDRVYVLSNDDTLEIRTVKVLWSTADSVLVRSGLRTGDRVVISPLAAPVGGMKLRPGEASVGPDGSSTRKNTAASDHDGHEVAE